MSKISVYDQGWADLVFEGRNKSYGAYQLRREDGATTTKALFIGIAFIAVLLCIPVLSNYYADTPARAIDTSPLVMPDQVTMVDAIPEIPKPPVHEPAIQEPAGVQASSATQVQFTTPVIVYTTVTTAIPETNDFKNANPGSINDPGNNNGNIAIGSNGASTGTATSGTGTATVATNGSPYTLTMLDENPGFPGGMDSFYGLVSKKFRTPEGDTALTAKVFVYFVIEKDGTMTGIKVTRDPGYGLGKEALRVLNSIKTKWKPGKIKGMPVRTAYSLPITVNIH